MKADRNRIGLALAGLAMLLAVAWTGRYAVHETGRLRRGIDRKTEALREVRALQAGQLGTGAATELFEALPGKRPADLKALAAKTVPGSVVDISLLESRPAAAGWTLRRASVTMNEVALGEMARFSAEAESGRPPWRLAECAIVASGSGGGKGRVTMIFEALEKSGP